MGEGEAMAIPKKAYLNLSEAAKTVFEATGDKVSDAMILDWAGQKLLRLSLAVESFKVMRPDCTTPETVSGYVGVDIDLIGASALASTEKIKINSCIVNGVVLELVRWVNGRYTKDTASFYSSVLRVASSELTTFIEEHCKPVAVNFPLNTHSTKYLRKLLEASDKFWKRYDPSLGADTAPTNEQVSNWLIQEGISAALANSMATILRADDLRSGRRKS